MANGISFTGDGDQDVGSSMPTELKSGSLSNGGPISGGPDTNEGMSTDNFSVSNTIGEVPSGSGIKFVGDRDSD